MTTLKSRPFEPAQHHRRDWAEFVRLPADLQAIKNALLARPVP